MPRGENLNQCLLVLSPQQIRFYPCMRAKCDPELTRGSDTGVWQVGAASVRRQKWQPRIRGRDSQESQGSSSDLDESYFKPWVHFGWEARRMRVLWLIKWENREKTKQPKVLQLFQQVSECLWLTACLLSLMSLKKEGTRQLALVLNQNNIVCCLPHFEKKKKLFAIASFKNHNMFFLRCKKEKHSCWRSSVKKIWSTCIMMFPTHTQINTVTTSVENWQYLSCIHEEHKTEALPNYIVL